MLAAEQRAARARRSTRVAIALSLAIHAGVLFFYLLFPQMQWAPAPFGAKSDHLVRSPLSATIAKRAQQAPAVALKPAPPTPPTKSKTKPSTRRAPILSSKNGSWQSGRDQTPVPQARPAEPQKPATAQEAIERALAMARGIGRQEQDMGTDAISTQQSAQGKNIEPLSLETYFAAFLTKLNRVGKFVPRPKGPQGARKGLVEITIHANGDVSTRVMRYADQRAEVQYIQDVLNLGKPFAALPPDILRHTGKLTLMMCIVPTNDGVGAGFSRSFGGGGDCRD